MIVMQFHVTLSSVYNVSLNVKVYHFHYQCYLLTSCHVSYKIPKDMRLVQITRQEPEKMFLLMIQKSEFELSYDVHCPIIFPAQQGFQWSQKFCKLATLIHKFRYFTLQFSLLRVRELILTIASQISKCKLLTQTLKVWIINEAMLSNNNWI